MRKCVSFIQTEAILLNRLKKKKKLCHWADVSVNSSFVLRHFIRHLQQTMKLKSRLSWQHSSQTLL